jgi:hypothetical protein
LHWQTGCEFVGARSVDVLLANTHVPLLPKPPLHAAVQVPLDETPGQARHVYFFWKSVFSVTSMYPSEHLLSSHPVSAVFEAGLSVEEQAWMTGCK